MAKKSKNEDELSDEEWAKFFELLAKVVAGPGSWKEKKAQVLEQADLQGTEASLNDFIEWFDGNTEQEDDEEDDEKEPTPTE